MNSPASQPEPVPGVCRYCGCTWERPCVLSTGGGETCAWFDRDRTICTATVCVARMHEDHEKWAVQGIAKHIERIRDQRIARLAKRKKKRRAA